MGLIINRNKDRAFELDLLRGVAIVMMMAMHFSWDIRYEFGLDALSYLESDWYEVFVHPIILVLFVGLSGICCSFSKNNLKRGLKLLGVALAFTVVTGFITYFMDIYCFILFNVLHMLSVSTLFYALVIFIMDKLKLSENAKTLILGLLGIYIMCLVMHIHYYDGVSSNRLLIPTGISVEGAPSVVDYMPLIPWMGVFLTGSAIGRLCYKDKKSVFATPSPLICKIKAPLEFLGRHSLIVYLIHQPIGYGILYVIFKLLGKI